MEIMDDIELLKELKSGSLRAYEQLFKKYYKPLIIKAFLLLKDEMEAEDLVQTIFIEIWDRQLYLNIDSSVKSYLYRAVQNRCLSYLNKQKTIKKKFTDYIYAFDEVEDDQVSDQYELEEQFNTALHKLPMQRFEAFNLVYIENKKYKEAAVEMGITVNSIKTHLKLALKVLRKRFVN